MPYPESSGRSTYGELAARALSVGTVMGKPSTHNIPESVGPAPPVRRSSVVSSLSPRAWRSRMSALTVVAGGGPAIALPSAPASIVEAVIWATSSCGPPSPDTRSGVYQDTRPINFPIRTLGAPRRSRPARRRDRRTLRPGSLAGARFPDPGRRTLRGGRRAARSAGRRRRPGTPGGRVRLLKDRPLSAGRARLRHQSLPQLGGPVGQQRPEPL